MRALQIVYVLLGAYGWWHWARGGADRGTLPVRRTTGTEWLALAAAGAAGTGALWFFLAHYTDSTVPLPDALTTALSLLATYGQARKLVESWWLWITADLIGMDDTLVSELRARLEPLGLRYAAVIAAASHTHSGPGAFARSDLFGFVAVDRESPRVRGRLFSAMEEAARQAERRKRPATVGTGSSEVPGLTDSREITTFGAATAVTKPPRRGAMTRAEELGG